MILLSKITYEITSRYKLLLKVKIPQSKILPLSEAFKKSSIMSLYRLVMF